MLKDSNSTLSVGVGVLGNQTRSRAIGLRCFVCFFLFTKSTRGQPIFVCIGVDYLQNRNYLHGGVITNRH